MLDVSDVLVVFYSPQTPTPHKRKEWPADRSARVQQLVPPNREQRRGERGDQREPETEPG